MNKLMTLYVYKSFKHKLLIHSSLESVSKYNFGKKFTFNKEKVMENWRKENFSKGSLEKECEVVVPFEKLEVSFEKKSSGAGGQNVNRLHQRVEYRFDTNNCLWMPSNILKRFIHQNKSKITKNGIFYIFYDKERTQYENKLIVERLIQELVDKACYPQYQRREVELPNELKEKYKQIKIKEQQKRKDKRDFNRRGF